MNVLHSSCTIHRTVVRNKLHKALSDSYNKKDKMKHGFDLPVVCGLEDIQVYRLRILHGSTASKKVQATTSEGSSINILSACKWNFLA